MDGGARFSNFCIVAKLVEGEKEVTSGLRPLVTLITELELFVGNKEYEITIYTSCCNTDKGIYYYTTYGNHQITAVDMNKEDLNSNALISYPLLTGEQIKMQN